MVFTTAILLFTTTAQAMEIWHFDQLTGDDQINFVSLLVASVEKSTKPDQLPRVQRFFKNKQLGEAISGMGQFEMNPGKALADTQTWVARNVSETRTLPSRADAPGMFFDYKSRVAFFIAKAAHPNDDSAPSLSAPYDNRMWWEQQGYNSYHDAVRATCLGDTTSAHPNC